MPVLEAVLNLLIENESKQMIKTKGTIIPDVMRLIEGIMNRNMKQIFDQLCKLKDSFNLGDSNSIQVAPNKPMVLCI